MTPGEERLQFITTGRQRNYVELVEENSETSNSRVLVLENFQKIRSGDLIEFKETCRASAVYFNEDKLLSTSDVCLLLSFKLNEFSESMFDVCVLHDCHQFLLSFCFQRKCIKHLCDIIKRIE